MGILLDNLIKEVKSNINEISNNELYEKINSDYNIILIDVRDEASWNKGHLPKAINCDRSILEMKIEKLVSSVSQEVIIYCTGGMRSALSAENLQRMGYTNVKSLQKGYNDWVASGYPIEP